MDYYHNPRTTETRKFPRDWKESRSGVEDVVSFCGLLLGACPCEYRNDDVIVAMAVSENGDALQFASDDLRERDNIITLAIAENPSSIRFASPKSMHLYPDALSIAIKNYPDIVSCCDCSSILSQNRNIAIGVVRANGCLLEHLPIEYRNDVEACEIAMRSKIYACKYIELPIEMCRDFVADVMRKHAVFYDVLPASWRCDESLARQLLPHSSVVYEHCEERVQERLTFLALELHGQIIAPSIPLHMRNDEECVLDMLRIIITTSSTYLSIYGAEYFWKHIPKEIADKRKELERQVVVSTSIKG